MINLFSNLCPALAKKVEEAKQKPEKVWLIKFIISDHKRDGWNDPAFARDKI